MLYRVKVGDSLTKIAMQQLGSIARWKEIARLNSLSPPYVIHPNELLLLPDVKPQPAPAVVPPQPKPKSKAGLWALGLGSALLLLLGS